MVLRSRFRRHSNAFSTTSIMKIVLAAILYDLSHYISYPIYPLVAYFLR
jgi:hypothetical protein